LLRPGTRQASVCGLPPEIGLRGHRSGGYAYTLLAASSLVRVSLVRRSSFPPGPAARRAACAAWLPSVSVPRHRCPCRAIGCPCRTIGVRAAPSGARAAPSVSVPRIRCPCGAPCPCRGPSLSAAARHGRSSAASGCRPAEAVGSH